MNATSMMELVAGYDTYAAPAELNLEASVDAPATSPVCAVSAASSWYCVSASLGASAGATYKVGC
ncbi:MAG: LxmA leader domain family RiPP [Actinomycetes bacterium]|jgi:hypothetical protein|nr:MAG: hypothetical protein DIU60_16415 [Actinomycetota bacterium]